MLFAFLDSILTALVLVKICKASNSDSPGEKNWKKSKLALYVHLTFSLLDSNWNGHITEAELESFRGLGHNYTTGAIRNEVDSMDMDGDRTVSILEFASWLYRMFEEDSDDDEVPIGVRLFFETADANEDNILSMDEFQDFWIAKGKATQIVASEFFLLTDTDNNGEINMEEFVALFRAFT